MFEDVIYVHVNVFVPPGRQSLMCLYVSAVRFLSCHAFTSPSLGRHLDGSRTGRLFSLQHLQCCREKDESEPPGLLGQ